MVATSRPSVAVVGGGPGGLMAAEVLATGGAVVTVYDRMPSVGRKLLVAGRGGLNLTHTEERDAFLARYGSARPRLEPALDAFDPDALRSWCEGLGQGTFVGSSGRVFPDVMRATPLLRAWLARLDGLGVEIRTRHRWEGFTDDGGLVFAVPERLVVHADATVLALGGATWPRSGSDGRWVDSFLAAEIDITPLRPANCGFVVRWSTTFQGRFAGATVKNVRLTHRGVGVRGDTTVTTHGLEGGALHVLSGAVRDDIDRSESAEVLVDLHPDLTIAALAARLAHRRPKDSAATALRRVGVQPVGIGIIREGSGNHLPSDTKALAELVKAVPLRFVATAAIDRAISAAGGVALTEIDERFMLRRRPGTFVAGEMLDWEAPTGGYLLQATFSTAVVAARGALAWLAGRGQVSFGTST